MDVYFGKNFWYDGKGGTPLNKIPVHDPAGGGLLTWGNKKLCIPAIYVGEKGAVLDLCMRVPLSDISAFMDKWTDRDYENMSDEELEQVESESPFSGDFNILLSLDGTALKSTFGCSTVWNPLMPETDSESEALMEEYGCSREFGWVFRRESFAWDSAAVLAPKKLDCVLSPGKRPVTVAHFVTDPSVGGEQERKVELTHPVTGDAYILTIRSCEAGRHDGDWGDMGAEMEYPSCYQALTYTIEPDTCIEDVMVQDCARGYQPRRKETGHEDSGTDSAASAASVALIPVYPKDGGEGAKVRAACSSMRFEPADRVEWRVVFHVKEAEDFCVTAEIR